MHLGIRVSVAALVCGGMVLAGGVTQTRAQTAPGLTTYHFTAVPGLAGHNTVPIDLDNQGRVLARADSPTTGKSRGFLWDGTQVTDLGTLPGGGSTVPLEMEDGGRVVGKAQDATGRWQPFVWEAGAFRTLPVPHGFDGAEARSIAPDGLIGGNLFRGSRQRAVVWTETGFRVLPLPAPYASSRLADLASGERAVGTLFHATDRLNQGRAVLWAGAEAPPRELGVLPGHSYSQANAINARGQVVGISTEPPYARWQQAFLWTDGELKGLARYGINSEALDINANGDVAGATEENAIFLQRVLRAAHWPADQNHGLRFFREPDWSWERMEGRRAVALNDAGQVLLRTSTDGTLLAEPADPNAEAPPAMEDRELAADRGLTQSLVSWSQCGLLCELVRTLRVDYLNDNEPIPRALNLRRGTLSADRLGSFKVYGLGGSGSVYDLTYPYFSGLRDAPRLGKVSVRVYPPTPDVGARMYYAELAGSSRMYLRFHRPPRTDRKVTVTFSFVRPGLGPLKTVYRLDVKGLGARHSEAQDP